MSAPKIPADFEVQPLRDDEHPKGRTTCGTCGLAWDDDIITSMTPAPSARCPFEAFHKARKAPKPYNGHHCWNCWNVALWIGNDEGLYRAALDCVRRPRASGKPVSATLAALRFEREVMPAGSRTPDGAKYTFKAVRSALAGLMEE